MLAAKGWFNRILAGVNLAMFTVMAVFFITRGTNLFPPWDGPAVVTIVLTAVTVVLGAVALGVALLAVWGYNAIRDHAGSVADRAATLAADQAVQKLMQDWGLDKLGAPQGNEIATAFSGETSDDGDRRT